MDLALLGNFILEIAQTYQLLIVLIEIIATYILVSITLVHTNSITIIITLGRVFIAAQNKKQIRQI